MLDKLEQTIEIGDIIAHFSQGGIYFGLVVIVQPTVVRYKLIRQMIDKSFQMTNQSSIYSALNSQLVLNITKSALPDCSVNGKSSMRSVVDKYLDDQSKIDTSMTFNIT